MPFEEKYALETIKAFKFGNHVNRLSSSSYIATYPYLLEASRQLISSMGEDSYVPIIHMAYGWMPKIISNISENASDVARIDHISNIEDFSNALTFLRSFERSPFNNSYVGLSKFLHFIKPDIFPIWDSRVASIFQVSANIINTSDIYCSYLNFCHRNIDLEQVSNFEIQFEEHFGYSTSKIRSLELMLFLSSES